MPVELLVGVGLARAADMRACVRVCFGLSAAGSLTAVR